MKRMTWIPEFSNHWLSNIFRQLRLKNNFDSGSNTNIKYRRDLLLLKLLRNHQKPNLTNNHTENHVHPLTTRGSPTTTSGRYSMPSFESLIITIYEFKKYKIIFFVFNDVIKNYNHIFVPLALTCANNQQFFYDTRTCNHTCRSLSGPDPRCWSGDAPVEGCGCPEGTHLNQGGVCTPKSECECHYRGGAIQPGPVVIDGLQWWVDPQK